MGLNGPVCTTVWRRMRGSIAPLQLTNGGAGRVAGERDESLARGGVGVGAFVKLKVFWPKHSKKQTAAIISPSAAFCAVFTKLVLQKEAHSRAAAVLFQMIVSLLYGPRNLYTFECVCVCGQWKVSGTHAIQLTPFIVILLHAPRQSPIALSSSRTR